MLKISIPLSVPKGQRDTYLKNYKLATKNTGHLFLFAGDQKVEHLNNDFVGKGIPEEVADPEHYFKIANKAHIGVFATQVGLMAKYGMDYPNIPYLIKINSKTNLMPEKFQDPFSNRWLPMDLIQDFKEKVKMNILFIKRIKFLF
jgi:fructose-bisphosphate aldolase/6-deoxy-5-ketofructose 1-phosphate synthase